MFQFAYNADSSLFLDRHNASSKLTDLSNDPKIQRFINNIPAKESSKREIYQHDRLRKASLSEQSIFHICLTLSFFYPFILRLDK